MSVRKLKDAILELGKSGCQGNIRDFSAWVSFTEKYSETPEPNDVHYAIQELIDEGQFKSHSEFMGEFLSSQQPPFSESINYSVSSSLENSPIQMVRSRLESFLAFYKVNTDTIIDLTIGTTEAMENAVKYSNDQDIQVNYSISNSLFEIEVKNQVLIVTDEILQGQIKAGKFNSTVTLMRGMMVMVKLFDDMDIDISEEKRIATFRASKNLSFKS